MFLYFIHARLKLLLVLLVFQHVQRVAHAFGGVNVSVCFFAECLWAAWFLPVSCAVCLAALCSSFLASSEFCAVSLFRAAHTTSGELQESPAKVLSSYEPKVELFGDGVEGDSDGSLKTMKNKKKKRLWG